ncbi:MAG TPA: HAD family hydrolase [Thermoanaerobaculia bacterium]|jgi:phosphoglycolate phosphatase-like HAD superfamily hydrolase
MSAPAKPAPTAGRVVGAVKARRLVLFDVDGTLLSTGPSARTAFQTALEDVFGTSGHIDGYAFEGRLDPLIVTDLMRAAGVPDEIIALRREDALTLYLDRLEAALSTHAPVLKPGVSALLDALEQVEGLVPALLTGNVERGARVKLSAAGLWHRFAFGVWGDEASRREDLGPLALERARPATGLAFTGKECVVVGDSRHDVACGLAIGARAVAVATGRTALSALEAAGAHVVLADLSDTERALEAILG